MRGITGRGQPGAPLLDIPARGAAGRHPAASMPPRRLSCSPFFQFVGCCRTRSAGRFTAPITGAGCQILHYLRPKKLDTVVLLHARTPLNQ
jgi:hypothetical protein